MKLNTDPKIYPSVEKILIDNKTCILIRVEESPLKPHLAFGKPVVRVGTTNQKIDRERYEYLLQRRFDGYGFDHLVQTNAALEDIDADLLYRFLETANSIRSLNENLLLPAEIILKKLDLLRDGGLTKASLLLFGKNPRKFFPDHYEIKCGNFINDEGYDKIINDKEYSENLLTNFEFVFNYILESIKKNSEKKLVHSIELYEFPLPVIREALVNMIIHRDYRQNIKSTIEIRPSTIIFYNPGHLFEPVVNIENLKKMHPSRPGNKLIAKIFYLMGLFENWGGGTLKIISETIKAGKPQPEFYFESGMFKLLFKR
jgi:ATP-dependent DNA helicase RecG